MYRKIKEAEKETGNKTPKKKPLYWEPLNSHFGGRQGAVHSNLLEDDGIIAQEPARDEEGTFAKGDVTPAKKRKAVVTDRLNAVTNVGSEIKQGLESLGDKMIQAMHAPVHESSSSLVDAMKLQAMQIQKTNELLEASNLQTQQIFETRKTQNEQLIQTQNSLLEAMTKILQK